MRYHPRRDNRGAPVPILHPSAATLLSAWCDPTALAIVVPGGPMCETVNGIPCSRSKPQEMDVVLDEPAFACPSHLRPAAGAVIEESDGRVWLVAPTNQFGGYAATFPKGTVDGTASLRQTAVRETWEEAALVVELTAFLCDVPRSQSFTRYYRARRLGGNPSLMGWETQAVMLVPRSMLRTTACHPNDQPILAALEL